MTAPALATTLTLLAGLTVMQILLSLGMPLGRYAWGGQHRILPQRLRIASVAAIAIYAVFAALLLSRAGILPSGESPTVVAASWVMFAYSVLSIAGNAISRSRPERIVQTPVSVLLSVGIFFVALGLSS